MSRLVLLVPLVVAATIGIATAHAQRTSDPAAQRSDYELTWQTVAGSDATVSSGEAYSLGGVIGHSDGAPVSGEAYTLGSIVWDQPTLSHSTYLPLVVQKAR